MNASPLRRRAFTLIELLIVITIIGILAVALVPRLTGGPSRARDAQRKSDLQQIATALEFYYNDNSGYPTDMSDNCVANATMATILANYMNAAPSDPSATAYTSITNSCSGGGYTYIAINTDTDATVESYMLVAHLENGQDRGQGVYAASGFSIPAWSATTAMSSATTLMTSTTGSNNGTRICYTAASACPSTTKDVLFVLGR